MARIRRFRKDKRREPQDEGVHVNLSRTPLTQCHKEFGHEGAHEMSTRRARRNAPMEGSTPSEMPRMIGDFDHDANAFWSLHMKEAKSHDEARIQSLKDDMDGVLIFVRVIFRLSLLLS